MRSPRFIATAVRKPSSGEGLGRIAIRSRPYASVSERFPFMRRAILRGVVTLLESMVQGMDALTYSANIAAAEEEEGKPLSKLAITASMVLAIVFGMGLFVALPHGLSAVITGLSADHPLFQTVDGVLKMGILLSYVYLISLKEDIRRVFEYHGAEHKSIYAFEAGLELTVENARKQPRLHPRCGTSFLLFLVLISIAVFSVVIPLLGLTQVTSVPILNHLIIVLAKIGLMLPVAGIAYEMIKVCAFRMDRPFYKALIAPGLALQRLTTREPSDDQLEVALASLKQVLSLEHGNKPGKVDPGQTAETEVSGLLEIRGAGLTAAQFPEL